MAARNRLLLALVAVMMSTFEVRAQPPDTLWTRSYGDYSRDVCWFILPQVDQLGTMFCGGISGESTHMHSLSAAGDLLPLSRMFLFGDDLWCTNAIRTNAGNTIVAGGMYHHSSAEDFFAMELSPQLDTIWTFSSGGWDYESCYHVQPAMDGGYLLAGYAGGTHRSIRIVKVDNHGQLIWDRRLWSEDNQQCHYIAETPDGGYLAFGLVRYTLPDGWGYIKEYKLDSACAVVWDRSISLAAPVGDARMDVKRTADNGWIVAGLANLMKVNASFDTVWTRNYGWAPDVMLNSVVEIPNEGYAAAGHTTLEGNGQHDYWLIRTDLLGNIVWTQTFGGDSDDVAMSISRMPDNSYVLGGWTNSYGLGHGYYSDGWVVRTQPDPTVNVAGTHSAFPEWTQLHANFPNPFNPTTEITYDLPKSEQISLEVFNLLGGHVTTLASGRMEAGRYQVAFDGNHLPSGVYIYRLQAGNYYESRRMILLK